MRALRAFFVGLVLCGVAMALALTPQPAESRSPQDMQGMNMGPAADEGVPAYHELAPRGVLPATMSPDAFNDPVVRNAYTVAARIKKTLYQQPCYCHCDRSQGHGSLLDCFVSKHGAGCQICIREDLYAYEQTRKGKTPAQIRTGIIHGEWQSVDVSKYTSPLVAK
ncbi:MAG TPA: CYCXC family (seleno)protein [Candidatus Dormibacteraeota bacterium]|nr:CYCXC family (seleno)protein [Candidatus Dormibacteraeota bacterium]